MHRTNIPADLTQEVLESAANAAEKGLSQFFTPPPLARHLATALPAVRPAIVDWNCGRGDLLQGGANASTRFLLGADIHNARKAEGPAIAFTPADLTLLYPRLVEVDWVADLFVLNPPWRVFWHRDRLTELAESRLPAVRRAFAGIEAGIPKGTIDSTAASLMLALDRCTTYGEGLLIANHNTLERLVFSRGAPHCDLAAHCWARVVIPGNPMTGLDHCKWQEDEAGGPPGTGFFTEVVYFAREHVTGARVIRWTEPFPSTLNPQPSTSFPLPNRALRLGATIRTAAGTNDETVPRWNIVRDVMRELAGAKPRTPWNLWLDETGYIRTALSSFETHSRKLNKAQAKRLFDLNGQSPMQLVLQRAQREELLDVAQHQGWRVQPELLAALQAALTAYHASRAPLYPLPDIQRLGYVDEQDWLECQKNLGPFRAGKKYPLRSQTVTVTRRLEKPGMTGEMEELEYTGAELALFLHPAEWTADGANAGDSTLREYSFMDARLKSDPNTDIPEARRLGKHAGAPKSPVDFTLQQLVEHFVIPEVPDVATVNPQGYQANLDKLTELEQTLATL